MEKNFTIIENEKELETTQINNDSTLEAIQIDNDANLKFSAESCTAFRTFGSIKHLTLGDLKNMTLAELYYIQN